ncbi:MAG: GDP-mannose 4,6-dehydratase [Terriglobales bacterium]
MKEFDAHRSVLIFGGAGFIGSNWAQRLLESTEAKVHIFDNLTRPGVRYNLESLQKLAGKSGRLQVTIGDVRDRASVEHAVTGATEIYHFAAQVAVTSSLVDPRFDFDVNVCGTFNVLEAARKSGNRPFMLFTSTNKVYGNISQHSVKAFGRRYGYRDVVGISELQPLDFHSPYGCSKGAADQYVRDYARIFHLPTVVLRMSCIAGPRQFGNEDQGWVAHFLYSALRGNPVVIYGDGRQVRDVLCVHDLLRVFELTSARRHATAGNVYNVGGGPENTISLLELVELIEKLTGRKLQYQLDEPRPGDQLIYVSDHHKLRQHTGWRPEFTVQQTVETIYAWWKENRRVLAPVTVMPARIPAHALQPVSETAA